MVSAALILVIMLMFVHASMVANVMVPLPKLPWLGRLSPETDLTMSRQDCPMARQCSSDHNVRMPQRITCNTMSDACAAHASTTRQEPSMSQRK